jgi:hypothetical protein
VNNSHHVIARRSEAALPLVIVTEDEMSEGMPRPPTEDEMSEGVSRPSGRDRGAAEEVLLTWL